MGGLARIKSQWLNSTNGAISLSCSSCTPKGGLPLPASDGHQPRHLHAARLPGERAVDGVGRLERPQPLPRVPEGLPPEHQPDV